MMRDYKIRTVRSGSCRRILRHPTSIRISRVVETRKPKNSHGVNFVTRSSALTFELRVEWPLTDNYMLSIGEK